MRQRQEVTKQCSTAATGCLSAETLAAALISTGTSSWAGVESSLTVSRREVGIYDPSVPDIEDDPTIFDDPDPEMALNSKQSSPKFTDEETGKGL